jgi:hypothetical protein
MNFKISPIMGRVLYFISIYVVSCSGLNLVTFQLHLNNSTSLTSTLNICPNNTSCMYVRVILGSTEACYRL